MEYPDYLRELMKELSAVEFLKITLKKLDEMSIKTEEEILLMDKVLLKSANISKEYKMRLLPPQLQEKFHQRSEAMKLDQINFLNMLKTNEQGNGPYPKPKVDITRNLTTAPNVATSDNSQVAFSIGPESNPEPPVVPSSDKNYRPYGNSLLPVERGGMTPKRNRSNSSSSSSSSSGSEERRSSNGKLQDEISRFSSKDGTNEKTGRLPAKYSFSLKKPESSSRVVRGHGLDKDDYFERGRAYEPRSERGEGSGRERDFRRSPERYYQGSNKPYKNTKKIYRPPQSYKH